MTGRPLDLLTDPRTGRLSTTKLWFNAGNAAMTFAFVWSAVGHELSADLLLAYGAVVAGNNIATKFLKARYDRTADPDR